MPTYTRLSYANARHAYARDCAFHRTLAAMAPIGSEARRVRQAHARRVLSDLRVMISNADKGTAAPFVFCVRTFPF